MLRRYSNIESVPVPSNAFEDTLEFMRNQKPIKPDSCRDVIWAYLRRSSVEFVRKATSKKAFPVAGVNGNSARLYRDELVTKRSETDCIFYHVFRTYETDLRRLLLFTASARGRQPVSTLKELSSCKVGGPRL